MKISSPPVPILRMFDVVKAREFYLDYLGWRVEWEHRHEADLPLYMEISKDSYRLHLSEHYGDGTPGSAVLFYVEDVAALHEELMKKSSKYLNPCVGPGPQNIPCMDLIDPFGNQLRFLQSAP